MPRARVIRSLWWVAGIGYGAALSLAPAITHKEAALSLAGAWTRLVIFVALGGILFGIVWPIAWGLLVQLFVATRVPPGSRRSAAGGPSMTAGTDSSDGRAGDAGQVTDGVNAPDCQVHSNPERQNVVASVPVMPDEKPIEEPQRPDSKQFAGEYYPVERRTQTYSKSGP